MSTHAAAFIFMKKSMEIARLLETNTARIVLQERMTQLKAGASSDGKI